ncbi:hypothetical protein CBS9595_000871 [Malassezia furfur]|nr:hypothetical protein CBS9595_000871 [Malassezia furfur]
MPRIPIRVEPYSSPAKQHRHYKCKRDQVLRALGKAAYINGSQFAILLVSARGDVETYASDALQDHLDDWFMKSGVAEEARQLTLDSVPERRNPPMGNLTADDLLDDGQESLSGAATPAVSRMADDPFLESWSTLAGGSEKMSGAEDWSKLLKRTDLTDEAQPIGEASGSAGSPPVPMVPQMSTPVRPPMRPRTGSTGRVAANAHQPQHTIVLKNEAERTAFLEMRFGQLQQVMCKMIAKEWIKVIEPKKQTRYPYNKGEEAKPSWWPKDVRHKEPDHLMKPERHALLLAMLRLNQARIARLQLATAEVVVQIKSGRVSLLMDIYRVAREEENLRDQNLDINTPITVGVSSLEGWEGESVPAADPPAAAESATPSTSQAREDYANAESLSRRLSTQRKRPRFDSAPEETPERTGGAPMTWTPMNDPHNPYPTMRGVPHMPQHAMSGGVPVRTMSGMNAPPSQPMQPAFDSSDLSSYSPLNPRGDLPPTTPIPTAAPHGALAQSPVAGRTNLVNYGTVEPEPQRSSLPGVLPVGNVGQPMKSTRSAPGQIPNSPEAWQMFQTHPHGQSFRMSQPAPSPLAMPPHREGDHRMSWAFAHPASPMYPGNAPAQPTWGMPETPMQQQPMQNLGMSVWSSDVRFSPSFDASFSNSGPMTPSNMSMHLHPVHPHMQAPGGAAMGYHAPPGKSSTMLGTDLASVPPAQSSEMGPFDVKLEPKPNVRYHSMEEWPCP